MHFCSKQGHCEGAPTLQQVAQRDCGASICWDSQDSTGHSPGHPTLTVPAWRGALTISSQEVPPKLNNFAVPYPSMDAAQSLRTWMEKPSCHSRDKEINIQRNLYFINYISFGNVLSFCSQHSTNFLAGNSIPHILHHKIKTLCLRTKLPDHCSSQAVRSPTTLEYIIPHA